MSTELKIRSMVALKITASLAASLAVVTGGKVLVGSPSPRGGGA